MSVSSKRMTLLTRETTLKLSNRDQAPFYESSVSRLIKRGGVKCKEKVNQVLTVLITKNTTYDIYTLFEVCAYCKGIKQDKMSFFIFCPFCLFFLFFCLFVVINAKRIENTNSI